jgi:hypothetical protein
VACDALDDMCRGPVVTPYVTYHILSSCRCDSFTCSIGGAGPEKEVTMLLRTFEKLILQAHLDRAFGDQLLIDPRQAALAAGMPSLVAESIAGLHASSLEEFAARLSERIYGCSNSVVDPSSVPASAPARRVTATR